MVGNWLCGLLSTLAIYRPATGVVTSLTPGREPTRNLPRTQTEPTRPASRARFFISATTTTTAALTSDSTAQTALESGICPPFRNTASKSCPHHETNPSVDCRRCLEGRCVPGQQLSAIRHRSPSGFSTPANTFQTVNRLWRTLAVSNSQSPNHMRSELHPRLNRTSWLIEFCGTPIS